MRFPAATWSRSLWLTSTFATLVLGIAAPLAYWGIILSTRVPQIIGVGVVSLAGALLLGTALFVVRGYVIDGHVLYVQRLMFSTKLPISGLHGIWRDPTACKGSVRLYGNAGLFAFTGLYRSDSLGMYQLFGTDLNKSVVLKLAHHVIVITPAAPEEFIAQVRSLFPSVALESSRNDGLSAGMSA